MAPRTLGLPSSRVIVFIWSLVGDIRGSILLITFVVPYGQSQDRHAPIVNAIILDCVSFVPR